MHGRLNHTDCRHLIVPTAVIALCGIIAAALTTGSKRHYPQAPPALWLLLSSTSGCDSFSPPSTASHHLQWLPSTCDRFPPPTIAGASLFRASNSLADCFPPGHPRTLKRSPPPAANTSLHLQLLPPTRDNRSSSLHLRSLPSTGPAHPGPGPQSLPSDSTVSRATCDRSPESPPLAIPSPGLHRDSDPRSSPLHLQSLPSSSDRSPQPAPGPPAAIATLQCLHLRSLPSGSTCDRSPPGPPAVAFL
jgi:hypothetical protein